MSEKIGFIGSGNMAEAIFGGLIKAGAVKALDVTASAPSDKNLSRMRANWKINTTHDNNVVVGGCDVIFLAVKPYLLKDVINGLSQVKSDHCPLFLSIVNGITVNDLEELLTPVCSSPRVIRTMVNTPLMVTTGCCVYSPGQHAVDADSKLTEKLFNSLGLCEKVPEKLISSYAGLMGSGPAYMYAAIQAMADGGVKMGIPRSSAQEFAAYMMKGAAAMVLETGRHPEKLKDEVCSPGGSTIMAMHELEKNGFRSSLMTAVETAVLASQKQSLN